MYILAIQALAYVNIRQIFFGGGLGCGVPKSGPFFGKKVACADFFVKNCPFFYFKTTTQKWIFPQIFAKCGTFFFIEKLAKSGLFAPCVRVWLILITFI